MFLSTVQGNTAMSTAAITLCCVDTKNHALSAVALRRCNELMSFAKTIFVTDRSEFVEPGWEHHRIKPFDNWQDFNKFLLKSLYFHIEADFILFVQYDGFILNHAAWTDDFLGYDYIGAPWPCTWKEYAVGTGGFSLRSKRLLTALQDDRIVLPPGGAEDLCMCRTYRSYLEVDCGIRFAPVDVASQFCYESGPYVADTFGFHGLSRLADFYTGDGAAFLAANLNPYTLGRANGVILAMQYAFRQQHNEAQMMFDRIAEQQTYEGARAQLIAANAPVENVDFFDQCWPRYVLNRAA
jgi:hypothetical protein